MKMTRPLLLVGAIVALAVAITIGSSLAYYSDRDAKTNVFTTGDVTIELIEEFTQFSQLMPGVDINKDVQITNTGENDAYVFYTYAIPAVLDSTNASKNLLHVNHAGKNWLGYEEDQRFWDEGQTAPTPKDQCWIVDYEVIPNGYTDAAGVKYNVYSVLYNGILQPGETTTVGMTNVYLDTRIDYDRDSGEYIWEEGNTETVLEGAAEVLRNNPKILVNAYGIQAQTFADVKAAYNAYIGQWGELQIRQTAP